MVFTNREEYNAYQRSYYSTHREPRLAQMAAREKILCPVCQKRVGKYYFVKHQAVHTTPKTYKPRVNKSVNEEAKEEVNAPLF